MILKGPHKISKAACHLCFTSIWQCESPVDAVEKLLAVHMFQQSPYSSVADCARFNVLLFRSNFLQQPSWHPAQ